MRDAGHDAVIDAQCRGWRRISGAAQFFRQPDHVPGVLPHLCEVGDSGAHVFGDVAAAR